MKRDQQRAPVRQNALCGVGKGWSLGRAEPLPPPARSKPALPGNPAEHQDHPHRPQQRNLALEIRSAMGQLGPRRFVVGGSAAGRGGDPAIAEGEPVVSTPGHRPVGEAVAMEGLVKPFAAGIAGEHPAGAVGAVRGRGEADDQEPRRRVAEGGHRASPVGAVTELALLIAGHPLPIGHEAGTALAAHDGPLERRQVPGGGRRQLTLRVFRFMKSMRMNWPSVIVLVKYALPLQMAATCLTNSTRLRSRASMNVLIMMPLRRQLATSR